MNDARNIIAIITGRKGSGKSHLLAQYGRWFPRRLVLDFTGEHQHEVPAALVAWSLSDIKRLLAKVAGAPLWKIVCEIHPHDVPALAALLIPMGRGVGYSQAVGGLVVECGELNEIAPNHAGMTREVAAMFSRGRHSWLSILAAARSTTEINNLTTSQADVVCAFRQHQDADVMRIGKLMGDVAARQLRELGQYEYLRYFVDTGRLERVDATGRAQLLDH